MCDPLRLICDASSSMRKFSFLWNRSSLDVSIVSTRLRLTSVLLVTTQLHMATCLCFPAISAVLSHCAHRSCDPFSKICPLHAQAHPATTECQPPDALDSLAKISTCVVTLSRFVFLGPLHGITDTWSTCCLLRRRCVGMPCISQIQAHTLRPARLPAPSR
jgi:hypothetical protein